MLLVCRCYVGKDAKDNLKFDYIFPFYFWQLNYLQTAWFTKGGKKQQQALADINYLKLWINIPPQ